MAANPAIQYSAISVMFILGFLRHISNVLSFYVRRKTKMLTLIALRGANIARKKKELKRLKRKPKSVWRHEGRDGSTGWWTNLVNGVKEDPNEWKLNLRLSKEEFMILHAKLEPFLTPNPNSPNPVPVSSMARLAMTLYYLKDQGSIRMTANQFGVAAITAGKHIYEVSKIIAQQLCPELIKLPQTAEEMRQKVGEFEARYGMKQSFGAVDGTHIPIKRPTQHPQDYFGYKQFHCLNVQAVCDAKGMFMDVDCTWPGSVHDAKVFTNSKIAEMLRENTMIQTVQNFVFEKVPNYLLGDPAYPLKPYLMKEYGHCKSNQEVLFNAMLRSARNPIECAFGRLKARWAILRRPMDVDLKRVPALIMACFALHNFAEQHNSYIDPEEVQKQMTVIKRCEELFPNLPCRVYSASSTEGNMIRELLTEDLEDKLPAGYC